MKYLAFAAALMIGSSALAQDAMQPAPAADPATTAEQPMAPEQPMEGSEPMAPEQPMTGTPPAASDPSMAPAEPMANDPAMAPAQPMANDPATTPAEPMANDPAMQASPPAGGSGMTVDASNQNPERDSRGIAVVSDAANAPSGANGPIPAGGQMVPASNQSAVFATQPSSKEYQACSRTVTDGCVQSYERGAGRPR